MLLNVMRWMLLLLCWPLLAQAEGEWIAGKHYEVLKFPVPVEQTGKIEVAEVFWYGCPHCYEFKPIIEAWEKKLPADVNFVLLPAALAKHWEPHARAFYALEVLGERAKVHDALFAALARDSKSLASDEQMADFFAQQGVDRERFLKALRSFGVNARLEKAQSKVRGAQLTGVPAVLVNGKYKTSATMAGTHENVLKVVDYLIEQERKTKSN